jgi:hypothetical protein
MRDLSSQNIPKSEIYGKKPERPKEPPVVTFHGRGAMTIIVGQGRALENCHTETLANVPKRLAPQCRKH